jgi:uncharacterized repeat protein (TIGR03803 family)
MMKPSQHFTLNSGSALRAPLFALTLIWALTVVALPSAQAQTFSVLHTFSGGGDGYTPYAGVTIDQGGNLYGTTSEYGTDAGGTVYQMKRLHGGWILETLASLYNYEGGFLPYGRPVFGPGGALYVTTFYGGNGFCGEFGCGTVSSLRPPQTFCRSVSCPWTVTTSYSFSGPDGNGPELVDPVFDSAGNMYGSTYEGGANYSGNVFELTRTNGQWTGTSIHDFSGPDGYLPYSSVTLDAQGNVYGTTWMGGTDNGGVVYRLTNSGSGWTYTMLYGFQGSVNGTGPVGGVVFDQAGNLYGATATGGSGGGGTVYELSPSGGGWNFSLLYSFTASGYNPGPLDSLTLDAAGNLYGTTYRGGAFGYGTVFKLTHNNGSWSYTDLHDFTSGADGANPIGAVTLDASGNLYGTASQGAGGSCSDGCGVVWELTP